MKDLTEQFLKQSPEFGRKIAENFGRVDSDVWKAQRMLKILGAKEPYIKVVREDGRSRVFPKKSDEVAKLVREYSEAFFLELFYIPSPKTIKIVLKGPVEKSLRESGEESGKEPDPEVLKDLHIARKKAAAKKAEEVTVKEEKAAKRPEISPRMPFAKEAREAQSEGTEEYIDFLFYAMFDSRLSSEERARAHDRLKAMLWADPLSIGLLPKQTAELQEEAVRCATKEQAEELWDVLINPPEKVLAMLEEKAPEEIS